VPSEDCCRAGATLRGVYSANNTTKPAETTLISFGYYLSQPIPAEVIVPGAAATANCPGTTEAPQAAPGHLCLYGVLGTKVASYIEVYDTETAMNGETGHTGMEIYAQLGIFSQGTWALTAP
jgi:hypothetical protein